MDSTQNWAGRLGQQLRWHWEHQARARLDGLSDEEYLWEPVPDMWNIRPRGQGVAVEVGPGAMIVDFDFQPPSPTPATTIAWRLAHLVVGVFGDRNARYFGGEPISYDTYDYPATAERALADLDQQYAVWIAGVDALSDTELLDRCREPGHDEDPMAGLVLHINREAIHHLAEIALLRDLYAHRE